MPRLILLQRTGGARQVHLSHTPFTVGRASNCDLVLDEAPVSRLHAVLELVAGNFQVRDHDSHNGTFVNGRRVQTQALANGDELRLGPCVLRFLIAGGELESAEALRLVTIPGKLSELDLQKLAARPHSSPRR